MNLQRLLLMAGVLTFVFLSSQAQAALIYYDGFEAYTPGSNISGQGNWTVAGVLLGDQAIVSSTQAEPDGGMNSLYLSQTVTGNRPRASIDLVGGGFVPAAINSGSISFAVCEDPANGSGANFYTINLGAMTLTRYVSGTTGKISFSVTSGGSANLGLTGTAYTYTPGAWNSFVVTFDNVAKTASLYINGGLAATITGASANYSVSAITLGLYSSSSTSDKVYFDSLAIDTNLYTYANSFENYTLGANVSGLVDGTGTWTAAGVVTGDQSIISSNFAITGMKSLLLSQVPGNRPRVSLNFVNAGYTSGSAAAGGTIGFSVLEKPNSGGTTDAFTTNIGNFAITRDPVKNVIVFSAAGVSYSLNLPFAADNYTYTPGSWNNFDLSFDNAGQIASLYINGGFAGTLVTPPGGTTADFTVSSLTLGCYSSGGYDQLYFDDVQGDFNGPPQLYSWRSDLYPANWSPNPTAGTPGYTDSQGRFLHDFSYAGYHSGAIPIPNITTNIVDATTSSLLTLHADKTGATDSTAALQAALDYVGTHGGGVVYLPAGTYKVAPPNTSVAGALLVKYSNVVLRGAGTGQTFILNTATTMRLQTVISVKSATPTDWFADNANTHTTPLSTDVTTPTNVIPVTTTSGFNVGDLVVVRNDLSTGFIAQLGMTGKAGWTSGNHPHLVMAFCRRITAIDPVNNKLTIDIPVRYALLTNATDTGSNARVTRPVNTMLQEVGLENFSIGMVENPTTTGWGEDDYTTAGTGAYQVTNSSAISLVSAENCWVKQVNTYHPAQNTASTTAYPQPDNVNVLSGALSLSDSRLITVDTCSMGYSQYDGNGGNGYIYTLGGQDSLVTNCTAQYGRHNFSFDLMECSGNVLQNCSSSHSRNSSDFHQYLSPANLVDNITLDGETFEAYYHSAGNPIQGWTTTQSVFWNTNGLSYGGNTDGTSTLNCVRADDYGHVYVIGTRGPACAAKGSNYIDGVGQGTKLLPQSLYLDQRKKRLGF